jgi:hypothetical protein
LAKYEFWAEVPREIVDIPDEELEGLSESEAEKVLLKHHMAWIDRRLYGDWRKMEGENDGLSR